jgi:hypothetical protein
MNLISGWAAMTRSRCSKMVAGSDFSQFNAQGTSFADYMDAGLSSGTKGTTNALADTALVVNITRGLSVGVNSTTFGTPADPFAGQKIYIVGGGLTKAS